MSDMRTTDTTLSAEATGELGRAGANGTTRVRITDRALVGPVLRRMVSIVLARADWPLDRLDDALLLCDALSAHAPAHTRGEGMALSVCVDEREAEVRVGELTERGAVQLIRDATLPVVGNVLDCIAERISVESEEDGGSQLVLVLRAS